VPFCYLSADVVAAASAFFAAKDPGALAAVAAALVSAVFEGVPESAATAVSLLGARAWQLELAARWQVVDVGGGTGFCTQGVVKTVPAHNVTLIDQSPHQLEKARKKADLQGVTIVEVRSAGALHVIAPGPNNTPALLLRSPRCMLI
jgi:protein-L-isoaspartate O-methyltransferase